MKPIPALIFFLAIASFSSLCVSAEETAPPHQTRQPGGNPDGAPETSGPITLRAALSRTLLENPELQAWSLDIRAAEAGVLQSRALPNPELGVEAENAAGSGEYRGADSLETTIGVSQLIELGGKRAQRHRVADLERKLAEFDYQSARTRALVGVAQAFADVLAAQERARLAEDVSTIVAEAAGAVSAQARVGKISPVEEQKAAVELALSRVESDRASNELELARKRLAAFWGDEDANFSRAEGSLEHPLAVPEYARLAGRLSENPDIARWAIEIERNRAALKLENANAFADPTVSAGVRHFKDSGDHAFVAGVSVPIPILNRNQGARRQAQFQLSKATQLRRAAELGVRERLAELYSDLKTAASEASTLRDQAIPAAESAMTAAQRGFEMGKFSYLETLDARRTYVETKSRYLDALAAWRKTAAEIEGLTGEAISGGGSVKTAAQETGDASQ
ncbi:MAG TPA: TolC family protein [Candidatus Brocadiia bacterium]|nr:TolC family protein [Candidatus Brocadiia bacterium]